MYFFILHSPEIYHLMLAISKVEMWLYLMNDNSLSDYLQSKKLIKKSTN